MKVDFLRPNNIFKTLLNLIQITENWLLDFKQIPYFEKAATVKTPAGLENLILKENQINEGDFVFIEWPKLQEEILITNERTALIRSDTSEY